MKNLESSYYLETGCAGEILHLADMYDEVNGKPTFFGICMAFYSNGYNRSTSISQRFRHIWKIITHGAPYSDELIFDVKNAKEVRDKLTELINKAEKIND